MMASGTTPMKLVKAMPGAMVFYVIVITLICSGNITLRAQPAPVQQLQNSQLAQQPPAFRSLYAATNAPELYQGENVDVGPQHILRLIPRPLYFNVLLDSQVFYSDNANFGPTADKIGSTVFVNTVQVAFTPPDLNFDNSKLSSSIGIASQWYNYENDRMQADDFNAQTAFLGMKYAFGKWLLAFDFSYTRLVSQPNDYSLTYQEALPALTLQRFFPINDTILVAVGNQIDYHFSDEPSTFNSIQIHSTEINNRFDDIISLTLTWQAAEKLIVQPAYRFMYSNYRYNTLQTSDRNDYLNYFGISVVYYFNKNFSLRTFFNYSVKNSDDSNAVDYHEYNGGLGASMNLAF